MPFGRFAAEREVSMTEEAHTGDDQHDNRLGGKRRGMQNRHRDCSEYQIQHQATGIDDDERSQVACHMSADAENESPMQNESDEDADGVRADHSHLIQILVVEDQ